MIFNFWYGHHSKFSLGPLTDIVMPIYHGLAEAGHRVIGFSTSLMPSPVVNVLVEFFAVEAFMDFLLKFRAQFGDNLVLGVLCTEDINDLKKMAHELAPRRQNLLRLLPALDFVWTLVPQVAFYESLMGPGKAALVKYGFTERSLESAMIRDPVLRDVDVALYGDRFDGDSPRHMPILNGLQQRGFSCVFDYEAGYPNYVIEDVIRRAKMVLNVRSRDEVRFMSQPRLVRALQSGIAVLAEPYDTSELSALYRYVEPCDHGALMERCIQIIQAKAYVEKGADALARFRAETSMRDNMIAAMRLPIFERLTQA